MLCGTAWSQKEGREKLFESYKITVCSEIRSYTDTDRAQAPQDSNQYFGVEDNMQYISRYQSPWEKSCWPQMKSA